MTVWCWLNLKDWPNRNVSDQRMPIYQMKTYMLSGSACTERTSAMNTRKRDGPIITGYIAMKGEELTRMKLRVGKGQRGEEVANGEHLAHW